MTDAVDRLVSDAEPKGPRCFTWQGETFEVHRVDLRVMAALEQGRLGRALTLMIGEEQTNRLLAIDTDEPLTWAVVKAGMTAWAEAEGSDVGESKASTES